MFQFTPPRGGRPEYATLRMLNEVSIHAPAWGATSANAFGEPLGVSIHAPAWGATAAPVLSVPVTLFQFTPPRGGRHSTGNLGRQPAVSIHAPAWGATPTSRQQSHWQTRFNSRPRVGGDPIPCRVNLDFEFQFTPPRGGRQDGRGELVRGIVSIHAPAWGATEG